MKNKGGEEFRIIINNVKEAFNNRIVKYCYFCMFFVNLYFIFAFGISAFSNYAPTFFGGVMAALFIGAYCIAAYFTISHKEDCTYISILYLILVYGIPCLWMGFCYVYNDLSGYYAKNGFEVGGYVYLQFFVGLIALAIAIFGIVYYYKNNLKMSTYFGFGSVIVSIIALLIGGISEIVMAVHFDYIPLVGVGFFIQAVLGILPLYYLFKTI